MGNKKEIEEYDKMLKKHMKKKHVVKFCRTFKNDDANISGYLLEISEHFLLIQKVYDLMFDGYVIIPKYCFDSLRYNEADKTLTKIMAAEDAGKQQWGIKHNIDLTRWDTIFTSLQEQDIHVVVECENKKNVSFLIGPVARVSEKSVSVQYYDATGRLNAKPTKAKYDDITTVMFGDNYSTVFRKYLKPARIKAKK